MNDSADPKQDSSVSEAPIPKRKNGNIGRPVSEKQREALKKGMEALKAKRELMAKEKEERKKTNEELKAKGLPPIEPPVKLKKQEIVELKPAVIEPVKIKERKVRSDKGKPKETDPMKKPLTREEFMEMRNSMAALKPQQVVKEVVVEKPVEKVIEKAVEKTKVLTGSELLNAIFFNK